MQRKGRSKKSRIKKLERRNDGLNALCIRPSLRLPFFPDADQDWTKKVKERLKEIRLPVLASGDISEHHRCHRAQPK